MSPDCKLCHTHYDLSRTNNRCPCGGLIQMTQAEIDAIAAFKLRTQQEVLFQQHLAAVARRREKFAHPQPPHKKLHSTSHRRF